VTQIVRCRRSDGECHDRLTGRRVKARQGIEIGHVEHVFNQGHAFGAWRVTSSFLLDKFQIEEFAMG